MRTTIIEGQISIFDLPPKEPEGITQDEIDRCFLIFLGAWQRARKEIIDFFAGKPKNVERAKYLWKICGVKGMYPCLGSDDPKKEIEMHSGGKGVCLRRMSGAEQETRMTWAKAARVVARLIESGVFTADTGEEDEEDADED